MAVYIYLWVIEARFQTLDGVFECYLSSTALTRQFWLRQTRQQYTIALKLENPTHRRLADCAVRHWNTLRVSPPAFRMWYYPGVSTKSRHLLGLRPESWVPVFIWLSSREDRYRWKCALQNTWCLSRGGRYTIHLWAIIAQHWCYKLKRQRRTSPWKPAFNINVPYLP